MKYNKVTIENKVVEREILSDVALRNGLDKRVVASIVSHPFTYFKHVASEGDTRSLLVKNFARFFPYNVTRRVRILRKLVYDFACKCIRYKAFNRIDIDRLYNLADVDDAITISQEFKRIDGIIKEQREAVKNK